MSAESGWRAAFREDCERIFVSRRSPYVGAILLPAWYAFVRHNESSGRFTVI